MTVSLRMTPAQREKLERLGGAKWVRDRIDRAKEPNTEHHRLRSSPVHGPVGPERSKR